MSVTIWVATVEDKAEVDLLLPGMNGPVLLMQKEDTPISDAAGTLIVDGRYAVLKVVHESDLNENWMANLLRLWMAVNEELDALYVPAHDAHSVFRHGGFVVAKDVPPGVAEVIGGGAALVKVP